MPQKVNTGRRGGRGRLRTRLLWPMVCLLLMQSLLHIALLWQGGVVSHADQNTYDILSQRINARANDLEGEMLSRWSALSETEYAVIEELEAGLAQMGAAPEEITRDAQLNARLVERTVPQLIYMLRKNMVTGAFIVLDGPALSSDVEGVTRAGFYIRDLDPSSYSARNTDLMVERGMPDISKRLNLAFDACWASTMEFPLGDDDPDAQFFFRPLNAARADETLSSAACGYWSKPFRLDENDIPVISYSIPLRLTEGQLVGVLGIDITESYVKSMLPYDELLTGKAGAYCLGMSRSSSDQIEIMLTNGPMAGLLMGGETAISLGAKQSDTVRLVEGTTAGYGQVLACTQSIALYDRGSPYEGEKWTLSGIARRDDLLSFSHRLMMLGVMAALISLALGVVGVCLATGFLTRPLTNLVEALKRSDPSRPVQLAKLGIQEIDQLTDSIETLSASVAESASKISKILSITQVPIGVFEYGQQDQYVFCSGNLPGLLDWPGHRSTEENLILPREEFLDWMKTLEGKRDADDPQVYRLDSEYGAPRYVKLIRHTEGKKTLGTVSDVTRDVLAKQRIEYERDYDLLTSLYNRRAFNQRLALLFTSNQVTGHCALIMWDLDDLKYINDSYGHDVGDRYIIALAECLKWFPTQGGALVARRSGDEFYTFLYGFPTRAAAQAVIDQGWARIRQYAFQLPGKVDYGVHVSGGVAWYPDDADNWQELLRYADYAMYNVKHTIKGNLRPFDKVSYLKDETILYGMEALNKFIEHELVNFAMQPVYDVEKGRVYGYEMLMRPQVAELRTVKEVLRIAQAQSRLYQIERLSWFGAMKAFAAENMAGRVAPDDRVFINSIASQHMSEEDIERFADAYHDYLSRIVMEITENEPGATALVERKMRVIQGWNALIAIDDYGTGYNSEASLIFLSPNLVKLDMSIVRGIDHDQNRQNLLGSLMAYAQTKKVQVVAEGVETEAEMRLLVRFGVQYLQGYYIAAPALEPPAIEEKVRRAISRAWEQR